MGLYQFTTLSLMEVAWIATFPYCGTALTSLISKKWKLLWSTLRPLTAAKTRSSNWPFTQNFKGLLHLQEDQRMERKRSFPTQQPHLQKDEGKHFPRGRQPRGYRSWKRSSLISPQKHTAASPPTKERTPESIHRRPFHNREPGEGEEPEQAEEQFQGNLSLLNDFNKIK